MHDTSKQTAEHHHSPPQGFLWTHVFSLDHKVIGKQYYFLSLAAVLIGMILSWLVRFHLAWASVAIPGLQHLSQVGAPGGIITPEYYLSLLTLHGTLMVFFVLTTAPQAGFGNYFLPIQIGAEDMAFPRLNMLSFWVTFVGFVVLVSTLFVSDGPPISGWTAYAPLSAIGSDAGPGLGTGQVLWVISIGIFCIGSLLGALNFIATTLDLRAKGMTLARMPYTTWAWFITAVLGLLALDHLGGTSFFIPGGLVLSDKLQPHSGGSTLLWQHMFWFFGHPEVYIAIIPGIGITSHILTATARKDLLGGTRVIVGCMVSIAFLSFMVWGHHMFISGMNPFSSLVFSVPTLIITIPASIVTLNWIGTVFGARLRLHTAGLFAIGFISVFVTGGLSGFFLAQPSLDIYLHATYFVVGHFHMVMGVAAIFGMFAGTYFWFPKMFGRMMSEPLGKLHFWVTFIGVYCIFMPMHFIGLEGIPRRYSSFVNDLMQPLMPVHEFMTIAALITGASQFIFLFNLFWSMYKGPKAPDNPWQATTLEWTIPSPPPFDNFGGRHPVVYRGPYEFSVEGTPDDFVMQDSPEQPAKS